MLRVHQRVSAAPETGPSWSDVCARSVASTLSQQRTHQSPAVPTHLYRGHAASGEKSAFIAFCMAISMIRGQMRFWYSNMQPCLKLSTLVWLSPSGVLQGDYIRCILSSVVMKLPPSRKRSYLGVHLKTNFAAG